MSWLKEFVHSLTTLIFVKFNFDFIIPIPPALTMPQELEVIQKLTAHKGKVWSASWHPNGEKLKLGFNEPH